jgi:excisionase family DNA binding protein
MTGSPDRAWYSVAEVAQLLGVSRTTVWRWIRAGQLPARRVGPRTLRVERRAVEARSFSPIGESGETPLKLDETVEHGSALRSRRASPQEREALFADHDPETARDILAKTLGSCPDLDVETLIAYIYRGRDEGSRA